MKEILIVGAGGIGERHLHCFLATGKVRASVCDSDLAKLDDVASQYEINQTFSDFDEIDLQSFDGVVIAVPPHLHIPMALKCAQAGVPFLLEKPLSVDLQGVAELKSIVEQKNLTAGVGYMRRSLPAYQKFREIALSGRLGDIKMAHINFSHNFRQARPDYQHTYYARQQLGGGCILDAASHFINFAEWIFGEPQEVASFYDRLVLEGVECEDAAVIMIRFRKNGALVQLFFNQFQKPNTRQLEVVGTKANLKVEVDGPVRRIELCGSSENQWETVAGFSYSYDDIFIIQAEDFLDALDGRKPLPTSIAEAESSLRVCLAAKQSQLEKRIVTLC